MANLVKGFFLYFYGENKKVNESGYMFSFLCKEMRARKFSNFYNPCIQNYQLKKQYVKHAYHLLNTKYNKI